MCLSSSKRLCLQHMPRLLHLFSHSLISLFLIVLFPAHCAELPAVLHLPLLIPPGAAQVSFAPHRSTPEMGAMGTSSGLQSKGRQCVPSPLSYPMSPFSFPCFLMLHLYPQNSVELRYFKVIKTPTGTRYAQSENKFGCKEKSSVLMRKQGWAQVSADWQNLLCLSHCT